MCCILLYVNILSTLIFIIFLYLIYILYFLIYFFFSSRRRHTRCLSDWSSDVCSSDLFGRTWTKIVSGIPAGDYTHVVREDPVRRGMLYAGTQHGIYLSMDDGDHWRSLRSEERRVGKECRSQWWPDYEERQRMKRHA